MPILTPSRIAILVLSLSLFSFFWTFGYPSHLAQPSQPIIDHYDHKNIHLEPIIAAPSIPTPTRHAILHTPTIHGDRPEEEDDHRWDDSTRVAGETAPTETGIAEYEKDGGRWEDKDKLKAGEKTAEKQASSAISQPTTLLTHTMPAPSGVNATNATIAASAPTEAPSNMPIAEFCKDVRGAPNVMIILRTSKAEIQEKLPAHMQGLLSCVPNFAIFSDHAGEIEGSPVHNALDTIGSETKRTHDEFREYRLMHADREHKPDAEKTKNLDKWKFLPMVYKAYHLKPDARFYFFIELDTSLSWTNILQWVDRLDYRIQYYSGAPTFINSIHLAQRGSGIMLSQGALRRYAKSYDELYTNKWEPALGKGCCGDAALAQALGDAHVEFYTSWPLMQGETPASLDYTPKQWCTPAVSWHHTNGEVLDELWNCQKNWTAKHGWNKPFLYRDAFEAFVTPHMAAKKEGWDNLAQDTKIVAKPGRRKELKDEADRLEEALLANGITASQFPDAPTIARRDDKEIDWDRLADTFKDAADSLEQCQKSCEQIKDCLQWRYKDEGDGECHLGKVLRLGHKVDEKWTSGWLLERVDKVTKQWECKEVNWKFYQ